MPLTNTHCHWAGIEPTEADIGRKVVYHAHDRIEEGTITSFNDSYVFVRFGSGSTSSACLRNTIEWMVP